MPKEKDFKKTGESYTAARRRILERGLPPVAQYAQLAGMSDEAVAAKTGMNWAQWVRALDEHEAAAWPHREIAAHVHAHYDISGWWAQSVTVGYERIHGLRAIGQRRSGSYEANKSKTFPVELGKLYRAFSVKRTRERWLPGVDLTVRTATKDKSMRVSWPDGTSLHVYFYDKGGGRSQLNVQHVGLADAQDREARKAFWTERLAELAKRL